MKNSKIKSILGENNKLTRAISVLFLIFVVLGLFAFILTGLYRFDLIEIPEFIQNLFFEKDDDLPEPEKEDGAVYAFLQENGAAAAESSVFEIALENIREALSQIQLPDNLYLETEARYYIGGVIARTENLSLLKKGDKYKYTLTVNSEPEQSYTNDTQYEYIENFKTGSRIKKNASSAFSFDNIPHITNINYYLDLFESGEITGFSAARKTEPDIVEIEYTLHELSQRELIYISLDTGVVERVYTEVQGELYYESETKIIEAYYDGGQPPEITAIQDVLFEVK